MISIVTPTHNCEKYISKTIESILNQTYKDFELIIIDDFSSDGTLQIINSYKDPRIKIIKNKKNMGAAYCRNKGIELSNGDYIAFLDGDDIWDPLKLEKQLKFMINNNYGFSCTNYYVMNDNIVTKKVISPRRITHKKFLRTDYIGCLTVMYKKSIFPDLKIDESIMKRNDYALWLKLSEKADCYCLSEYLATYNKHSDSISSISKAGLVKYHCELFKKLYGFNNFKANIFALRNVIYYILKEIRYVRKVK